MTGRANAWGSGLEVIANVRARPLASDWCVQQHLVKAEYYTHTHNTYLQMFLKYGPFAVIIWFILARTLYHGFVAGSPYAIILALIMLGWLFDYWLFMTKATFVYFALIRLNEKWVRKCLVL
jgi:hypothetical protein